MMINLGALEKDRAGIDTGLLTIARNAYPTTIGWEPMPRMVQVTSWALPAACKGLFFARTASGGYQVYAGTATKLYKLVSNIWVDYTRTVGGNYATGSANFWQGAQWGSLLILVNGSDAPQVIDVDSGATNFSALAGSPPVSVYIGVVGDFVFLMDATNRKRAINCGTTGPNTATSWTVGTDLCDEYIAPDGGSITSPPMLGEYGLVMQEGGIARRIVLQPGDAFAAFRFEKIEGIKGCVGGYSCVAANGKIFYQAEDGVYSLGPDGSNTPVGSQRVDRYFRENSDQARLNEFQAFADPYSTRIYWAYYTTSSATTFDGLLGYDWLLDRFFFSDAAAAFWAPIIIPGQTLEALAIEYPDLDAMTVSLDSRQFQGGRPTIGAVRANGGLVLLSGTPGDATIQTSAVQLVPPVRALNTEVEVRGDLGSASVEVWVGKRERPSQALSWVGPFTPSEETGIAYPHVSARHHAFEVRLTGEWTNIQQIATTEQADGER